MPRHANADVQGRKRPSTAGRVFRAIGLVLMICLLAAAVALAVLTLTDIGRENDVSLQLSDSVEEQIRSISDYIRENTVGAD